MEAARPVLEINPSHPLLVRLADEKSESRRKDWAELLVDQATLAEGGRLADPGAFVSRLNEVLIALSDAPTKRARPVKKKAKAKAKARSGKRRSNDSDSVAESGNSETGLVAGGDASAEAAEKD